MSQEALDAVAAGDEKETLMAYLDNQREIVIKKITGASDEDVRKRLVPSITTLLGVVNHLAYMERWWFQDRFLGLSCEYPWTDEDPDAEFKPEQSIEEVVDFYKAECETSREIIASADLDQLSPYKFHSGGGPPNLRWIILHMIEETARHAGHMDILREQLDGVTGE